jgi:VWFA-related protein
MKPAEPRTKGARGARALLAPTLAVCLGALCGAALGARGRQTAQNEQQVRRPTFRVEANLVRLDAIVTRDGEAVHDLTVDDFEVREDGAVQKLASFEHINISESRLTATPGREPNTVAESRAAAQDPRARLFVVFLDRYHTGLAGSHRMQRALGTLLERVIGPDDLVAVMTPDMAASDVTFTRRTSSIGDMLVENWAWGVRGQVTARDPEELAYEACFPERPGGDASQPGDTRAGMAENERAPARGVAQEMIDRRREKLALDALTDLALHLRGLREERKAVIVVTDGWILYRPDERLGRVRPGEQVPGLGRPGTDPQGRLVPDVGRANPGGVSRYDCETDRMRLAMIDNRRTYLDLMDTANRGNVSFYPVDSRGLPVFDTSLAETFPAAGGRGSSVLPPSVDQRLLGNRIETLRTLAENTDGLAVVNSNDIEGGLRRVVEDLSSYYLMSYYSTNAALDGKYRTIAVRVKRPGLEVRARKGYRAATAAEMTAAGDEAPTSASTVPAPVRAAFARIAVARADLPLRSHVAWISSGGATRVYACVELDARTLRQAEWAGTWRAELTLTDAGGSRVLARRSVEASGVPAGRVTETIDPEGGLPPGDYLLRARLTPPQAGLPLSDTVRFSVPAEQSTVGTARFARRNATTGRAYVATADLRFRRTDWLRLTLPLAAPAASVTAELVDQRGQFLAVPVAGRPDRDETGEAAVAELALAPLAAGDYAVRIRIDTGGTTQERVIAFRVIA